MESEKDLNIQEQLEVQQQALVKIYASVEKTRKYMLWTGITSIVFLVIPLIVVVLMLPKIIHTFSGVSDLFLESSLISSQTDTRSLEESFKLLETLF